MDRRFDDITAALSAELTPARFCHTLGVLHTATVLAAAHGADLQRVQTAALLHDCAKGMGREALLAYIRDHDVPVSEADLQFPAILHGPVGADVARRRFGIDDAEVLEAIAWHPVGLPSPSRTLQILMAADFCEPTRDFDGVQQLRDAVRQDLRSGLLSVLQMKNEHLAAAQREAHPNAALMTATLEEA